MSMKPKVTTRRLGEVHEDLTDWAGVDALTEEDLAEAIRTDPDDEGLEPGWVEQAVVVRRPQGDEPPREGDEIPEQNPAP